MAKSLNPRFRAKKHEKFHDVNASLKICSLLSLWLKLAKNHLVKVQGLLMASKLHTNLWVVSKKYAGNMPTVGIVQHASGFPKLYKAVYLLVVHIMLL